MEAWCYGLGHLKGGGSTMALKSLGPQASPCSPQCCHALVEPLLNARLVSLFLIRQKDPTISETLLQTNNTRTPRVPGVFGDL